METYTYEYEGNPLEVRVGFTGDWDLGWWAECGGLKTYGVGPYQAFKNWVQLFEGNMFVCKKPGQLNMQQYREMESVKGIPWS